MADEVTLSSNTSTQEEVNEALGIAIEKPAAAPKPEGGENKEEQQHKTEQEHKEAPEKPGRKGKSYQERIDELTREKYRLREELARAEGAQRGEKKNDDAEAPSDAKKVAVVYTRPKPDKDDPKYKDWDDYNDDLAKWHAEQIVSQDKAEAAQKAQNDRLRERFDNFNAQIAEAKTQHDDWDEVASDKSIVVPKVFDAVIPDFPNGAEMLYYVGTHPEFRQKLLEMNDGTGDIRIIHELSRLSDYLEDQTAAPVEKKPAAAIIPTPKPQASASTTPTPIKPVGGGGTVGAKRALDEVDYQTYKRRRRAGEG